MLEEAGIKTLIENLTRVPGKYIASIERKNGRKTFCQKTFLCNTYKGELKATEEATLECINIDKLDELKLLANVKTMIFDALKLKQNCE